MKYVAPHWIFGYCLLAILGFLSYHIAMDKVQQDTSYGLNEILICLTSLASAFAGWAFGSREHKKDDENKPN
jgi:hypothetical protein